MLALIMAGLILCMLITALLLIWFDADVLAKLLFSEAVILAVVWLFALGASSVLQEAKEEHARSTRKTFKERLDEKMSKLSSTKTE